MVWLTALLMCLGEVGIDLGPLLAGAGVLGVAIASARSRSSAKFLSGLVILVEDQFGVGDIVDVGEATGAVEAVSLRTARLRAIDGTVWHVPNGEIRRVGNMSQHWSRALLDIEVAWHAVRRPCARGMAETWCAGGRRRARRNPSCGAWSNSAPTASCCVSWSRRRRRSGG